MKFWTAGATGGDEKKEKQERPERAPTAGLAYIISKTPSARRLG
jgi:hypothetical protein